MLNGKAAPSGQSGFVAASFGKDRVIPIVTRSDPAARAMIHKSALLAIHKYVKRPPRIRGAAHPEPQK
jgi:hypothetical protein